jgi:hypothetical protein
MIVQICTPIYTEGIGKQIEAWDWPWPKHKTLSKK